MFIFMALVGYLLAIRMTSADVRVASIEYYIYIGASQYNPFSFSDDRLITEHSH
jgi:hypothetical protein